VIYIQAVYSDKHESVGGDLAWWLAHVPNIRVVFQIGIRERIENVYLARAKIKKWELNFDGLVASALPERARSQK